jgi:hypothetical protein
MAIVVVGGHSRNIGKTSVVCALIAAMPERHWTAIKITHCKHHGMDSEPCDCELAGQNIAISEEHDSEAATDSSRYLGAGAMRSFWVRTQPGKLVEAMPRIRAEIAHADNVIFESNRVLEFIEPDVYLSLLDPKVADFKGSALQYLSRADAILGLPGALERADWPESTVQSIQHMPVFQIAPPDYASQEFVDFVSQKISSRRP